jgi:glycosyltransferase involved in cell wall biosynthesis
VDCLTDGEDALLTDPGEPGALADNMRRLLTDDALRRRLARAALAEARTDYAWTTRAEQIADLYRELKGTAPNTDWTAPAVPPDACRFREEPSLL